MAKRKVFNHRRNLKGVQFEKIRREIDPGYTALHDSLEDAYYNYWKNGEPKEWEGYNVQATVEESKLLFDRLHGLIFLHYHEELHSENLAQPEGQRYDERKYDLILDEDNQPIGRRSVRARQAIEKLETDHNLTLKKPERTRQRAN